MTLPNEQNLRAKPDGREVYWHSTLDGELPVMQLSADYPRPVVSSFLRARASVALDPLVYRQIRNTCQQKNVTLFVFLLAAFKTLLLRHTTQEDIIVSSLSSASTPSAQGTNGQRFTNVLALRTNLEGNPDFVAVLKRVSKTVEEAGNNRDYPFEKLVEYIQTRQASLSPIFQTMFILRDTPSALAPTPISEDNLADVEKHSNKFDLVVLVCPKGETLTVTWEYDTELFESTTILRLLDHYQVLLEGTGANPEQRLSELPLLTEAERHQLLVEWNDTKRDYPKDKCIHELFEAQVERIPDAVAVVGEGERLSYRELDDRADRLARQLRAIGVGPDVLVGICLERSVDLVVGLLGILKAGGAYVPIDPAYPAERIGLMIEDSAMTVLLTQERVRGNLPESRCRVVSLEQLASEGELHASDVTRESAGAENLAYVIYTSGSTGRPKGVEIQHKALVNFLHSMRQRPGLTPQDVLLSVTTISFDIAGLELFLPLVVGACVVIMSREVALDGRRLMEQLENSGATVMQATPATWRMLIDVGWSGRKDLKILCGGEALAGELASQLLERGASLWNLYGPTESTIWSTLYRVEAVDGAVPIGRPIGNTEIHILDRYLKPVPVGVPGELHIGGAGLARGYLNRPELTEEKFIRHPFSTDPSARLYKTGDLARYLSDGNIEYLGRLDHQIKIRGFRIELGEIESMLSQYPSVRENVVVAWEVAPGDKRLVAYCVFAQTPPPAAESLRSFLKEKLPDYMVPSAFVELDALPLTPNGKVDRKALPALDQIRIEPATTFIAPRNPIEEVVAEIWADVLKMSLQSIGVRDNFFELGGNSLLAVRLFAAMEERTGKRLPLASLFQAPTIEQMANLVCEKDWSRPWNSLVAIQPGGSKPPLFCVHAHEGNVLFYRDLVRYLGADQPFYGLQAQALDGKQTPLAKVEDMAVRYIEEIRSVQPKGPYFLGGYCFGGLVAFEIARKLDAEGEQVALLALFDAYTPEYLELVLKPKSLLDRLRFLIRKLDLHLGNLSLLGAKEKVDYVKENIKRTAYWVYGGTRLPLGRIRKEFLDALDQAFISYLPQAYPGRVTLFRGTKQLVGYDNDPQLGWGKLAAGGVEIHRIPGYDGSVILEPRVRVTVEQLRACLRAAQAEVSNTRAA
jgi:aspartate racemase